MLLLRDAQKSDLASLAALAKVLDTVNLPHDERALVEIVDRSVRSFAGKIRDPLERTYVFVAEEPRSRRIVGTSMIIAQHGTHESPCTFFDVSEREHYSSTLDRHFKHQVLSLGFHFDGPTEIGGLVVEPARRGGAEKAGKQLAFVRFLYMAAFRERFRETVLAELLPPLTPDGRSLFWEAFGARFTGLDYKEADKRSRENKEFIQQLFPPVDVYATLFQPAVRRRLGQVGPRTRPVRRLLERIGFRYVNRIDPFDGGPHYEAKLADVTIVRAHRRARLLEGAPPEGGGEEWLAGIARGEGRTRFRAVRCAARLEGDGVQIPEEAREVLRVRSGERLHLVPFA
ncbi:arginine N-succinyltransferase [Anaeromyxobacter oryzisoli]|uniref:arginine N-succinyltransferase n=1 Tax=Anaeromyxobacter oryzisoli TaxID=2925408 RepID=UPI001F58C4C6|nr:arginine N-succinyltransferase [Anaeromyxobacter sp. SG63]